MEKTSYTEFVVSPGWPDGPRPTWEERSGIGGPGSEGIATERSG